MGFKKFKKTNTIFDLCGFCFDFNYEMELKSWPTHLNYLREREGKKERRINKWLKGNEMRKKKNRINVIIRLSQSVGATDAAKSKALKSAFKPIFVLWFVDLGFRFRRFSYSQFPLFQSLCSAFCLEFVYVFYLKSITNFFDCFTTEKRWEGEENKLKSWRENSSKMRQWK